MTRVLVGYLPDERGDDALALAALVARQGRTPLTVANIYPPGWPTPGPGRVDAEWLGYVKQQARAALDQAAARLGDTTPADAVHYVVHPNRGSGRGLIQVAEKEAARLVVIGSAPRGRPGRIAVGSTADQLLHASPVPVLLAPRGYAAAPPEAFTRLTVAYRPHRGARLEVAAAGRIADWLGVPVRLLTLLLRPPGPAGGPVVADLMRRQREQAARDLAEAAERAAARAGVSAEVAEGVGVDGALRHCDWSPGEILACMSSAEGPLRRVFLGSVSGKIVRVAACPVLVLPGAGPR
ncbi:universal stress protein [Thermomonospora cellulosilytica]|uniref:Nucleotide-binding universal stress UspA family protein n=1 Tax=Thermomonospora cellulosilytica TaxID=1411118 RepID=A0A7W3N289_9ACTN|nr:universal stress protein [Thermomonospora cellulosilytica]MBA9006153.1 nucleotide-binding universal stress UspA family protein [Thermomonospora cellulosilytica]